MDVPYRTQFSNVIGLCDILYPYISSNVKRMQRQHMINDDDSLY